MMIEKLRAFDSEFSAQLLSTLFYIASHSGCHKQAMEEDLGLSSASGSRNSAWLSKAQRLKKDGLDLGMRETDPFNGRRLQLKLTDKGQFLIDELKEILYD